MVILTACSWKLYFQEPPEIRGVFCWDYCARVSTKPKKCWPGKWLVGGFNPSEKYPSKWVHLPQIEVKIKISEATNQLRTKPWIMVILTACSWKLYFQEPPEIRGVFCWDYCARVSTKPKKCWPGKWLVGGFNPSEKYESNWIISPGRDENKHLWTPQLGNHDRYDSHISHPKLSHSPGRYWSSRSL